MAHIDDPYGLVRAFGDGVSTEPAAEATRLVATRDPDRCECGGAFEREVGDLQLVCDACGLTTERDTAAASDDDAPRPVGGTPRPRIVGPRASLFQSDLLRGSPGATSETRTHATYGEYCELRRRHISAGGVAPPIDACKRASEHYYLVQQQYVKRAKNKRQIMAACLHTACIELSVKIDIGELAKLMQLPRGGIAPGVNFLRGLVADGKADIAVDMDPSRAIIKTQFAHLGLDEPAYDSLQAAVLDIVQTAERRHVATKSMVDSKVAGATYVVLQRSPLIAKPPTLAEFCGFGKVRQTTVSRFAAELAEYHSLFVGCYRRAGLRDD